MSNIHGITRMIPHKELDFPFHVEIKSDPDWDALRLHVEVIGSKQDLATILDRLAMSLQLMAADTRA